MRRALLLSFVVVSTFACSGSGNSGETPPIDDASSDDAQVQLDGATPDGTSPGDAPAPTDSGTPPADAPIPSGTFTPGKTGCVALVVTPGAKVDGSNADTFAWSDADCRPRTTALIRNDAADAQGGRGGYARVMSYEVAGKVRTIKGTGSNGWQGFGYIVNHFSGGATTTKNTGGTYKTILAGKHHAIHEYKWRVSPGGALDVTAHWFFATGRSHPLFAITFDASPAGSGTINADTRAPYGDLAWDDGKGGDVSGVGWGDANQFTTTGPGPVTPKSPWDYTKKNAVPYAYEWANATDAEMGLVATEAWANRVAGGDYGSGTLATHWGKSGTNLLGDIPDWLWPFQLNQYELPFVTTSHRIAWGSNFGAVGKTMYSAFGKSMSGYPYQSYTVAVVLGQHAPSAVAAAAAEIEAASKCSVTASLGSTVMDGPGGVGRSDKQTYVVSGWDPIYAAWTIDAAPNATLISIDPTGGPLRTPLFVIRNYGSSAAPSSVVLGGKKLVEGTDYFATVDAASKKLWLTLNATLASKISLSVDWGV